MDTWHILSSNRNSVSCTFHSPLQTHSPSLSTLLWAVEADLEFVKGGLLNSANRRPSWEIREWRESSHSISLPSFLPAGLPRWCVPLLKSTAPFLGSLRPMGGNGSLLLLAWSNVLSLTVSLNPDYTSVKSPCIKFFSNFLTWPCCMFPLGLRLILGINDLFSIPSATSCLNLCNLPA